MTMEMTDEQKEIAARAAATSCEPAQPKKIVVVENKPQQKEEVPPAGLPKSFWRSLGVGN